MPDVFHLFIAIIFIIFVYVVGIVLGYYIVPNLSQETLDDICINLTDNPSTVGEVEMGKLICETPSYDSTTNIIVRKTGEERK